MDFRVWASNYPTTGEVDNADCRVIVLIEFYKQVLDCGTIRILGLRREPKSICLYPIVLPIN